MTKIIFGSSNDENLDKIFSDSEPLSLSLKCLGKPLVIYNIDKIISAGKRIDTVVLPEGSTQITKAIEKHHPTIHVDQENSETIRRLMRSSNGQTFSLPLNSVAMASTRKLGFIGLKYPWDIYVAMMYVLARDVTRQEISEDAEISENVAIKGPCKIEAGAKIDYFTLLRGPIYVGANSRIWSHNLVRESMIGANCVIGAHQELARAHLNGSDRIAHHNVILDSVLADKVWAAGDVMWANRRLDFEDVKFRWPHPHGEPIRTGLKKFCAIVGHDVAIGAGVVVNPGRYIPPHFVIAPNVVYNSEKDGSRGSSHIVPNPQAIREPTKKMRSRSNRAHYPLDF